ncbi:MAG: DNA translocase FtsK [Synergistaceae bacterium]|nr:DNA translocase FtsK [Synergistaceae bacterium]
MQEELPGVELPEDLDVAGQGFRAGARKFPPPIDIFGPPVKIDEEDAAAASALANGQAEVIVKTLRDFGVRASVAHVVIGPSVIQFQLELAPGIKVSKVSGLANDLTMALAVVSVRVEAPILGQRYVGIEIPNPRRKGITLRSLMESEAFREGEFTLPLPMGVRVDSKHLVCGLEDMPHLLVAGTTGSGKSVFTNTCILGMCSQRSPDELKLILVDPKHVEFAIYEGLPHLLARPVSDPKKAIAALTWAVQEMETRSEAFAGAKVRNLASYNEKVLPKDRFPHIVVVVDELADLMYTAGKEVENLIARLAQKARAAGIHLILATQRPSVDVITGLIKANVPARVAFAVPSQTDSRTIIDTGGAEKLLGKGDMLFYSTRYPRPLRLQASFITEERTLEFVAYMKNVFGEPECIDFEDLPNGGAGEERPGSAASDPKLAEAIRVVMNTGIASASGLQRHLNIGYPRAGRLISGLELLGVVGPQPANSSRPREILMDEETALDVLERARGQAPD